MTTLRESYRMLEVRSDASDEEVQRAHRELTKVWHPDRFGNDPELRRRAEEKLKAINEAWETIRASREGSSRRPYAEGDARDTWRVRWNGREVRVAGLHAIVILVHRGAIGEEAEIFDPAAGRWAALGEFAELRTALTQRRMRRNRTWAVTFAVAAIFLLVRRPTPGGLVIALVLFAVAIVFIARMRSAGRV
ncbi:MAG: J domain-containing protein [Thermoanaerobaculia bacterium]